jgi:Arc/MetJ-type ribon-helix-helix transcriptional regulator
MKNVVIEQVKIPKDIYSEMRDRIRLGLYSNESEVISSALKKVFAQESREFLRSLVKREKITEKSMLNEWGRIRN